MNVGEGHLTSLDFDRLAMGGATRKPGALDAAEAHLARCARCAARRDEHQEMREHFRARVFSRTIAKACATPRRHPGPRWGALVLGLALPAVAVVPLVLHFQGAPGSPTGSAGAAGRSPIGVKGTAAFHVFARLGGPEAASPGEVVKVLDGTRLAPGDALRFVLDPTGLPYVLIASVDGAGQVSIYYPYSGESSALVGDGGTLSVPDSIVLDRAPGPERLFALFSREPIASSRVREALAGTAAAGASAIRAAHELPIGDTVQATVVFEKDAPP